MNILRSVLLSMIIIFITGCAASAPRFLSSEEAAPDEIPASLDRPELVREIINYLGSPYKYGGHAEEGIDCSAFTQAVFADVFSIEIPRSVQEQFKIGKHVRRENLLPGDLVFFHTSGLGASHVGIYLGDDLFAHASVNEGVTITSLNSNYYQKRFFGAKRVLN